MGWLSNLLKPALRLANDHSYNQKKQTLQDKSYNKVGKEIQKARKSGHFIDAKKRYSSLLNQHTEKLSQKHERTRDFINDL